MFADDSVLHRKIFNATDCTQEDNDNVLKQTQDRSAKLDF